MRLFTGRLFGAFSLKLGLALAIVTLGDRLFFGHEPGGLTLGVFLMAVLVALMTGRPAIRHDPRALVACAGAAAVAVAMAWKPSPIAFLLFWIAAGMATLLPRTARFDDGWRWFQRLIVLGLWALPAPLVDRGRVGRALHKRRWRAIGPAALLRLLALPLLGSALVLFLFAAANPVIEGFLDSLRIPVPDGDTTLRVIFWSILGLAIWTLLRPRTARHLLGTFDGSGDLALPGVSTQSVLLSLAAFNLLFAAQNAMDAAWLWGLVPLPEGMTLADYAHRGAYPLILTALFAGLFVLVFLRPGSTTAQAPAIRRLVTAWIAQNLFLVASSILRTVDYINAYSLTVLRISALLWMALVAVGLVLILVRLLRERSAGWLINANLAAAGLLLGMTCFIDLSATTAWWNLRHAREFDCDGAALDLCYMDELGASALLPLVAIERGTVTRTGAGTGIGIGASTDLRSRAQQVRRRVMIRSETEIRDSGGSLFDRWRLAKARQQLGFTHSATPRDRHGCYSMGD